MFTAYLTYLTYLMALLKKKTVLLSVLGSREKKIFLKHGREKETNVIVTVIVTM